MRVLLLSAVLALAVGGQAAAQSGGLVMLPAVRPTETSPIDRMPKPALAWIAAERVRQAAEPGDLVELSYEIQINIGEAIMKIAQRERIDTRDIILVVMHQIMADASDDLGMDLRKARTAGAPPAEIQALTDRKALVDLKLAEVVKSHTVVSRSLLASQQ